MVHAGVVSSSPRLRLMLGSLRRRRSSGGRRLRWRWRCLRHHSITILVARFLVTTGLHWSPFGLLIAGLGVIITHPWCFDWALYPSMPLLVTLETSHHAALVSELGWLQADCALPLHDPVYRRWILVALVYRLGGGFIRHVVKVAGTGGLSGRLAVTAKPPATSLLHLMLCPPPLIICRGMHDPLSPCVEVTVGGPGLR